LEKFRLEQLFFLRLEGVPRSIAKMDGGAMARFGLPESQLASSIAGRLQFVLN